MTFKTRYYGRNVTATTEDFLLPDSCHGEGQIESMGSEIRHLRTALAALLELLSAKMVLAPSEVVELALGHAPDSVEVISE